MVMEKINQPEADPFAPFIGRLVKAVYLDGAGELKIRKGWLIQATGDFVLIRTYVRTYLVPKRQISELKELKRGEGEGRNR
ncbi:MAG: hypothetical protein QXR87_05480 [Candidatus Hadarchaeales archaeon]